MGSSDDTPFMHEVVFDTSTVEPAKSLPYGAKQCGAVIIEINPNPTSLSHSADFSLNGPAGIILPEIVLSIMGGL